VKKLEQTNLLEIYPAIKVHARAVLVSLRYAIIVQV